MLMTRNSPSCTSSSRWVPVLPGPPPVLLYVCAEVGAEGVNRRAGRLAIPAGRQLGATGLTETVEWKQTHVLRTQRAHLVLLLT
jgi:hypothetical protein